MPVDSKILSNGSGILGLCVSAKPNKESLGVATLIRREAKKLRRSFRLWRQTAQPFSDISKGLPSGSLSLYSAKVTLSCGGTISIPGSICRSRS